MLLTPIVWSDFYKHIMLFSSQYNYASSHDDDQVTQDVRSWSLWLGLYPNYKVFYPAYKVFYPAYKVFYPACKVFYSAYKVFILSDVTTLTFDLRS
jgi:hypothetical protein